MILGLIAGAALGVLALLILLLWLSENTSLFWHSPVNGGERIVLLRDAMRAAIQQVGGIEVAKTVRLATLASEMQDYLQVRHISLKVTETDAKVMLTECLRPPTLGEAIEGMLH